MPTTPWPSLRERLRERDGYRRLLGREARRPARLFRSRGARAVFVFGSVARGEARVGSALDLAVVMPSEAPQHERALALLRRAEPRVPVDVPVLTPGEFYREPSSRLVAIIRSEGVKIWVRGHGRERAAEWLALAESDLAAAGEVGERVRYHLSCHLSQQAAEKALYASNEVPFPFPHSIGERLLVLPTRTRNSGVIGTPRPFSPRTRPAQDP